MKKFIFWLKRIFGVKDFIKRKNENSNQRRFKGAGGVTIYIEQEEIKNE